MIKYIVILFFYFNVGIVFAQTQFLSSLSQKSNYFLSQDSYHKTWISSVDGINVFDGANVQVYKPGKYNMIGNNIQSHFFEDCKKDIWFSTYNALHLYQRDKDNFIPFQFLDEYGKIIENEYKVLAYQDEFIYLKYGNKFGIFDLNVKKLVRVFNLDLTKYSGFDISILDYSILLVSHDGTNIDIYQNFDFNKSEFYLDNTIKSNTIRRVQITGKYAILFNNGDQFYKYYFESRLSSLLSIEEHNVKDFYFRNAYQDLIVLSGQSIKCIDKNHRLVYNERIKEKGQISPLNVFGHQTWYGIDGKGLFFFDGQKRKFDDLKMTNDDKGVNARGLFQDTKDRYWYTSRSDGIGQFKYNGELIHSYKKENKKAPTNMILNLVELNDGTILGAGGSDIIKFNENTNRFESIRYKSSLSNHFFGSISILQNGSLILEDWNNQKKLFKLNKINNEWLIKEINFKSSDDFEKSSIKVFNNDSIFFTINGSLLGIGKILNDSFKITNIIKTNSYLNDGIKLGSIYYLAFSDGLYKMHLNKLEKVDHDDPLLNQTCYNILSNKNDIYISTNTGLIKYNIESNSSHQFSLSDGLQEHEFNKTGCLKDTDGNFWFGGINGINKFNPDKIKLLDHSVPINISSIKLNSKEAKIPGILNDLIKLRIKYTDNNLEFNLNGIDYSDPEKVELKYILKNYEKDWSYIKQNKANIRYPNLPPGHYTLQIFAANSDGIWNKTPKSIDIEIIPPFWMTWWFYLISICTAILFLYSIIISYYKRKDEKQKQLLREQALIIQSQTAIEKERTRIASEMHDDLGSGLTTIKYLSDKALTQAKDEMEKEEIRKIAAHSNNLVSNMGEIIWAMNSRFDDADNLFSYIRRYASEYLDQYHIEISFINYDNGKNSALSGEKRRNVFLVVKEILHNAVKYSGAKKIEIEFIVAEATEIIISEIGGIGFDIEEAQIKSNGIFNMQKRMNGIGIIAFEKTNEGMVINIKIT